MRVEEMALRSEIRQMLNEAGFNKNTLKDLVKEVLTDELRRAINHSIAESDLNGYVSKNVDRIIKDTTKKVLEDKISDQLVNRWFHRLEVSVDVKPDAAFIKEGDG